MFPSTSKCAFLILTLQTLIIGVLAFPNPKILDSQVSFSVHDNDNGLTEFDFNAPRLVRFFSDTAKEELDEILEGPVWISEQAKLDAKNAGRGYIDVYVQAFLTPSSY